MEELDNITIHRAVKGDKSAFRALYNQYAPFIWRIILKMTRDQDTAGELMQDTFINVHRSLKKFKSESRLSTWVYRIAFNTVLTWSKRQSRFKLHSQYLDETVAGKYNSDIYETKELVEKVMSGLSVEDRFLLVAREVDGLSFEELSSITGDKSGALRTRLHRMKENIRSKIEEKPYHGVAV